MRAILQRTTRAQVFVQGQDHGAIERGWVVLLGIAITDTTEQAEVLAEKILFLRGFEDDQGKMNRHLIEIGGGLLIVSNFTLMADCNVGRRPSFTAAARPEHARPLYDAFVLACRRGGVPVVTGSFGADMKIQLVNDGPVTFILER